MVLCNDLYISLVGSSSVMFKPLSSKYNLHNFLRKPKTPVIPAVFQGFACSKGPKNISYKRNVSAPYSSQISSGLTTLYFDLDIFSTSRPTMYFPFSSKINFASVSFQYNLLFLKAETFNSFVISFITDKSIRYGSKSNNETNSYSSLFKLTLYFPSEIISTDIFS